MAQKMSLIPFGFWHYYFHRGTSIYYLVSPDFGASSSIQSTNFLDQPALTSWISQHFKCNRTRHKIIELIISTRETTTKVKRKMLRHVHFVSIYKSCQASNVMIMLLIVKLTRWNCSFFPQAHGDLNIDQCPSGSVLPEQIFLLVCAGTFTP
jgi:hypothetical protein